MKHSGIRRLLFSLLLLATAAVLTVIGFTEKRRQNTFVSVTARITQITSDYDPVAEQTEYTVRVSYSVGGTGYEETLGSYRADYAEGQTVEILYNPEDPRDITAKSGAMPVILWAFAGAALIAAVVVFVRG